MFVRGEANGNPVNLVIQSNNKTGVSARDFFVNGSDSVVDVLGFGAYRGVF